MSQNIYVGNLPFEASEDEIRGLFEDHGSVQSVKIITDRDTGRSRGFAFVEMDAEGAEKAIAALHQSPFGGRNLTVNVAKPREDRPRRNDRY